MLKDEELKRKVQSERELKLIRTLKRIRYQMLIIAIGIGITILTLITALTVFLYLVVFGGPAKRTQDISKYENMFNDKNVKTAYIVFPEKIPEGTIKSTYDYYYRDTFNTATIEVFLQCVYDDDTYNSEIQRLTNTQRNYNGKEKGLLRDTNGKFEYPAFVASENAYSYYEYALLTGKNEITYICTGYRYADDINFDKKYLPNDFPKTFEDSQKVDKYSIYWITEHGSDMDYSRETDF